MKNGQDRRDILATPAGFAESYLGFPKLYDWQIQTLNPFQDATGINAKMVQVACASPNEGGRSSYIVAGISAWWLTFHNHGKVGITTADTKQLNEQIIPALDKCCARMGWKPNYSPYYRVVTPRGGRLIAFTTNDAGRVEGLHKGDNIDSPLLWIVDEAKSVDEEIFQGIDRCSYNALLLASSCGLKTGRFYEAFTKNRAQFKTVAAGLKDCPHIAPEKIERIIAMYGENHPFTRSSIYGEFMDQDEVNRYILNEIDLRRCLENPPVFKPGFKFAFCDFGGGHDEHVIAYRDGNKIEVPAAWRDVNKEASAGRFIREFRKLQLKPEQICGDAADREMLLLLEEAGWPINRQNFGAPSSLPDIYLSWSAQAWIEMSIGISKCEWILPTYDDILFSELTTRFKNLNNRRGKLGIEEKYEMRKRNIKSPSRADAVVGAAAQKDYSSLYKQDIDLSRWREYADESDTRSVLTEIGAFAGGA